MGIYNWCWTYWKTSEYHMLCPVLWLASSIHHSKCRFAWNCRWKSTNNKCVLIFILAVLFNNEKKNSIHLHEPDMQYFGPWNVKWGYAPPPQYRSIPPPLSITVSSEMRTVSLWYWLTSIHYTVPNMQTQLTGFSIYQRDSTLSYNDGKFTSTLLSFYCRR